MDLVKREEKQNASNSKCVAEVVVSDCTEIGTTTTSAVSEDGVVAIIPIIIIGSFCMIPVGLGTFSGEVLELGSMITFSFLTFQLILRLTSCHYSQPFSSLNRWQNDMR